MVPTEPSEKAGNCREALLPVGILSLIFPREGRISDTITLPIFQDSPFSKFPSLWHALKVVPKMLLKGT
jgi:hypothetical protein